MRALLARLGLVVVVGSAVGAATTATTAGCAETEADLGRDAALQVSDAQFYRADLPTSIDGPPVRSVTLGNTFRAGAADRSCIGDLERTATSVAIALVGDVGYWIVRAAPPSASALAAPTFSAALSFSAKIALGPRQVVFRAIDADGRFGPPFLRKVTIDDRTVPSGELVFALSWDNRADLDLHVVDPHGVEIFKRNPSSYEPPPPGSPREPPDTPHDGGILDFDSNAQCVTDGRRAENVVWTDAPSSGHYIARVDTFSLCGEPEARWRVRAILRGVEVASAEGQSTPNDERYPHNRGDGLLALEIDVP